MPEQLTLDKIQELGASLFQQLSQDWQGYQQSANLSAQHAPKGGITIQGEEFKGGQWIPSDVMAKATPEEKHELAKAKLNPGERMADVHPDYKGKAHFTGSDENPHAFFITRHGVESYSGSKHFLDHVTEEYVTLAKENVASLREEVENELAEYEDEDTPEEVAATVQEAVKSQRETFAKRHANFEKLAMRKLEPHGDDFTQEERETLTAKFQEARENVEARFQDMEEDIHRVSPDDFGDYFDPLEEEMVNAYNDLQSEVDALDDNIDDRVEQQHEAWKEDLADKLEEFQEAEIDDEDGDEEATQANYAEYAEQLNKEIQEEFPGNPYRIGDDGDEWTLVHEDDDWPGKPPAPAKMSLTRRPSKKLRFAFDTVMLSFDESKHPRGDDGRFVSIGDIHAAKSDPAKADKLRERVTKPEERAKLEERLGEPAVKMEGDGEVLTDDYDKPIEFEGSPLRGGDWMVYKEDGTPFKVATASNARGYHGTSATAPIIVVPSYETYGEYKRVPNEMVSDQVRRATPADLKKANPTATPEGLPPVDTVKVGEPKTDDFTDARRTSLKTWAKKDKWASLPLWQWDYGDDSFVVNVGGDNSQRELFRAALGNALGREVEAWREGWKLTRKEAETLGIDNKERGGKTLAAHHKSSKNTKTPPSVPPPTPDHRDISTARKSLASGTLTVHRSDTPIQSATGATIRRYIELPSGAKIHPDELHRAKSDEQGTYFSDDEGLTVIDGQSHRPAKTFRKALDDAKTSKGTITIQSPHGYSVTLPGSEWGTIEAGGQFHEWLDSQDEEDLRRRNVPTEGGATEGTAKETEDFFQPRPTQSGWLFSQNGAGRWVTIGGKKGEDGKRKGGSPVYIENGRITKGHPSLEGRKINALKEEEPLPEYKGTKQQIAGQKAAKTRDENIRSASYDRAKWGKKARAEGVDPKHLHQLAADFLENHKEFHKEKTQMLKDARTGLDSWARKTKVPTGQWKQIPHIAAKGGDHTSVKHIDSVVEELQTEYPTLFNRDEHLEDQLFEMLAQGNPEAMTEDEAYEQAFDYLMEMKHGGVTIPESTDDEIPLSQGIALSLAEKVQAALAKRKIVEKVVHDPATNLIVSREYTEE